MEQLEELHDRLVEAPHADKTKAWISKPSVRSLNEWITGGLEKLIQGDETLVKDEQPQGKKSLEVAPAVGPFSHYSAISSTAPSAHPSPSPSYANLHSASSSSIGRVGSASGNRAPPTHSSTLPAPAPPRASSAMDHSRGRASPSPKVLSAGATSTSFRSPYQPTFNSNTTEPDSMEQKEEPPRPLYAQWWGDNNDEGVTPTATSFSRDSQDEDSGNFISLMDSDPTLMPTSSTASTVGTNHQSNFDDEEDDLGFGNSKKPKKNEDDSGSPTDKTPKKSNGNADASTPAQGAQPATPAQGDTAGKYLKLRDRLGINHPRCSCPC
jgi:COPII coat assembly protein SEC16